MMSKVKRRWRIPKAKPGELLIKWGKPDRYNDPDIVYANGPGTHHGDGHYMYYVFGTQRISPDTSWRRTNGFPEYEDSFLKELDRRGYDLTTLKFSIQKKKPPEV